MSNRQTVFFVTLHGGFSSFIILPNRTNCNFCNTLLHIIRWRWNYLLITVLTTFPCNHFHGVSLSQFPANAPDILSTEMSGTPEILFNVQVNHAFLLRFYYKVVQNFFEINLSFYCQGFQQFNLFIFTLCMNNQNFNVHLSSNWVKKQII